MAMATMAKRPRNNFVRISSIPLPILGVTIATSWLGMVAAIILGYPLWVIGIVTILPWLPIFLSEALWKYQHYGWFAIFGILMVVQCLHFIEHIAQIIQVDVVGWPRLDSTGILGRLDLEYVHFSFDTTLLIITSILLFGKFRRNIPLWIAWVVAVWHTIEHWYITYYFQFDHANYLPPPAPGLHAREGLLGADGLLWPSSPFQRIELHFLYNLLYTVPLIWAFVLIIRQAYDEYLKKAFPRLTEAQLANLNTSTEQVEANAGELIVRQGDPADKFYIIAKGEVEILQAAGGGQPTVVNRLKTGQFFGEVGLLTSAPRNASVRAVTHCELLALDRDTFRAVMSSSVPTAHDYAQVLTQRSGARIPAVVFPSGGGAFLPGGGSSPAGGSVPPAKSSPAAPSPSGPAPASATPSRPPHAPAPVTPPNIPTYVPPGNTYVEPPIVPTLANSASQPPGPAPSELDDKTIDELAPQFRPASSGWVYGLIFSSGPQAGHGVVLSAARMQIGRDIGNEIRLSDDSQVSRRHAELLRTPTGDYQLRDLNSANGVYINRQRIPPGQLVALKEHDEVRIGQSTFAVRRIGARVV